MKIETNNIPRDLICFYDVPEGVEREYLDYIEGEDKYSLRIVKYKGAYYDVNEFECTPKSELLCKWDGVKTDSYFSAVLLRYVPDSGYESVIMATATW